MDKELAVECIKTQKQIVDDMTKEAFDKAIEALREISILAKPSNTVEVVRCGECKHGEKRHTANYLPFTYCTRQGCSIKEDDYCSYGEREGE